MKRIISGLGALALLTACTGEDQVADKGDTNEATPEAIVTGEGDIVTGEGDEAKASSGILDRYTISSCSPTLLRRDLTLIPASEFMTDESRIYPLEKKGIDFRDLMSTPPYNPKEARDGGRWECVSPVGEQSLVLLTASDARVAGMLVPTPFSDDVLGALAKMGPIASCVKECGDTDACFKACMADRAIEMVERRGARSWWGEIVDWWNS